VIGDSLLIALHDNPAALTLALAGVNGIASYAGLGKRFGYFFVIWLFSTNLVLLCQYKAPDEAPPFNAAASVWYTVDRVSQQLLGATAGFVAR
jgi:hypothetical protein